MKENLQLNSEKIKQLLEKQGVLFAFILCLIGFAFTSDRFLSSENIFTVLRQVSIVGSIALGVTVVVISGNLDLSVGSMVSFATVLVVDLHDKLGPAGAITLMFLFTLMWGMANGFLIGFLKLNSLIVTLGMLSIIQGVTLIYTNGQNVDIANQEGTWFSFFGRSQILGIGVPILIFGFLAILIQIIISFTVYGRMIFAVGGNRMASLYSGIRSNLVIFSAYLISAFTTACAALIIGSRVMGSQNNVGQGYELLALAGVILGGTSLLGGSGNIIRTVIGILILGFIQNGLLLLGFPYYSQWLVTWVVIILAVWLDISSTRKFLFIKAY